MGSLSVTPDGRGWFASVTEFFSVAGPESIGDRLITGLGRLIDYQATDSKGWLAHGFLLCEAALRCAARVSRGGVKSIRIRSPTAEAMGHPTTHKTGP